MSLDKVINDAIITAISQKVFEAIQTELRNQRGSMVEAWYNSQKATEELGSKISKLETAVQRQTQQLEAFALEREKLRQTSTQAKELLQAARKELGIVS